MESPRSFLKTLFEEAVAAAQPRLIVPRFLPPKPTGRIVVVGVGKAAAAMALAMEDVWGEAVSGVVITRYQHALPTRRIRVREAAHPISDEAGLLATRELTACLDGLTAADTVVVLLSGGGSALLVNPAGSITLSEWNDLNHALLLSGATIQDINRVRKHLSAITGGRLAALCFPAQVVGLVLSDIPGDDLSMVASGPLSGEDSSPAQARRILDQYGVRIPPSVAQELNASSCPVLRSADPMVTRVQLKLIGSASQSLEAAAALAKQHGVEPWVYSDALTGEAADVGRLLAQRALDIRAQRAPVTAPAVLLSGGETTVTMNEAGPRPASRAKRGGRNGEGLLSAAIALAGCSGVTALFADTDGIDGSEANAGAFADGDTVARLAAAGLSATTLLDEHQSFEAFDALADLLVSGPTHTNVNDFRAILVLPE